ncbi:MAG: GNAT family N-acetyltransferase [Vicinamibacterales bacterium]
MVEIREARPEEIPAARAIFTEYVESLATVAAPSFAHQRVDDELRTLPGRYASPGGAILLAWHGRDCVGCVAVRPLDPPAVCELKRMYVVPAYRGTGLGRRLCETALAHARRLGYREMKLDSDPTLTTALALYARLGFVPTPRYNADPDPATVYLAKPLGA